MIVRMIPRGRFLGGLPPSDTLFGALCWGVRWTHGEQALLDSLLVCDQGEPPFLLSSTFPYAEVDGRRTYYLPRPLDWPTLPASDTLEAHVGAKRVRRVAYLSSRLHAEVLTGRLSGAEALAGLGTRLVLRRGFLSFAEEPVPHLILEDVDRNAINRLSGAVEEGALFFGQETGIAGGGAYFLLRLREPSARPLVEAALRFLEDRGIGGDASVGRGQAHIEWEETDLLPEETGAPHLMTLSLFHPSPADRAHLAAHASEAAYRLVKRKGRVESLYAPTPQPWKQTLIMLAEGSVFPRDGDRSVYGCAPVVKDVPFRVRHNGFAYTVGVSHAH